MSRRFILTLTNNKTNKEEWFQLFGNHECYETFIKYVKTLDVTFEDDEEFLFENAQVTDIKKLIQAIDETIWNEIISKYIKPNKMRYDNYYSSCLDFSNNLLDINGNAYCSLFSAAHQTFNYSYMMMSYSVHKWLEENGAIINKEINKIKHDYFQELDYVKIGELDPNFSLTITRE